MSIKNYISIAFLISFSTNIMAQEAKIENLEYDSISDVDLPLIINYPIIYTNNNFIDSLLNNNLKNDILYPSDSSMSIRSALSERASYSTFLEMDYHITYNKNGIISIEFFSEFCGASCDHSNDLFVYSLKTGKRLMISDILDTTAFFQEIVKKDVYTEYQKHINAITESDTAKYWNEFDKEYLNEYIIPGYEECRDSFNMDTFGLFGDELVIDAPCFFPRREFRPEIALSYKIESIKKYLKVEI